MIYFALLDHLYERKNICVLIHFQHRIHVAKQYISYVYPCASIMNNAFLLCVYYMYKKLCCILVILLALILTGSDSNY